MTLRPGCAPARLLLELWAKQGRGFGSCLLENSKGRARLVALGFIKHHRPFIGIVTLTQAGRYAAQTLDAGSR